MDSDASLVCDEAVKSYGDRFTLGPLTFTIGRGVTCLVGPNGAGKSTFFRLAAHIDRTTSGKVWLRASGENHDLGYLPQEPVFPEAATPAEHLVYTAWLHKVPPKARSSAVAAALESVGLASDARTKIRRLSGGMKRRLGIAQAILHNPALVLLDEPTVGLDPRQRVELRHTIERVSRDRVVIVSTHLVEDVRGLADRVIVLNDGQVAYDGDVAGLEAKDDPESPGDSPLERAIALLMGART